MAAYTVMATQVTGYVVLATDWNNIVNNFTQTAPGLVTTDGDIVVATGANANERLAAFDSSNLLKHEVGGLEFDANAVTTGDTIVGQSSGVMGLETAMSQVQAEGGTDTQVRGSSAERIKQAITALESTGLAKIIARASGLGGDVISR